MAIITFEATLVLFQNPTMGAIITTVTNDTRQTLTLAGIRVTAKASWITLITVTGYTTVLGIIPVISGTSIALASSNTRFTGTFTRMFITLSTIGGSTTITSATTQTRIITIMIRFTHIATFSNNIFQALAGTFERITFHGAQIFTITALAVFQFNGITIETRGTQITSHTGCIIQTS